MENKFDYIFHWIWTIFKLWQGASINRFVGQPVCQSVGLSVGWSVKKVLQLENDLSEQILENESYSGTWLDSK